MKNRLILLVASVGLVSSAFAANNVNTREVNQLIKRTNSLEKQVVSLRRQLKNMQHAKLPAPKTTRTEMYTYGSAITASPYVGIRAAYDASDLITNLPSMNEDLVLLEQRQKLKHHLYDRGMPQPDRPLIELSGHVEGQVWAKNGYATPSKSDIDLSGAEIDLLTEITHWATGYMSLSYDHTPPALGGTRVSNSRIQISRAFATIGNLDKLPGYATIGQIYIPYGVYANFMTTDPLTQVMGRLKQRAAVLGLTKWGMYGSVYALHGDSHTKTNTTINNWGLNFGYGTQFEKFKVNFGLGYLANIADSDGIQNTGSIIPGGFSGLGYRPNNPVIPMQTGEKIGRRVAAYNVHGSAVSGPFTFLAEYVGTLRPFAFNDLNFNGKGARLSAVDVEGAYKFPLHGKPIVLSAGYGKTWQALMVNLPEQSYMTRFAISLFKDTIESLEYRHDVNYRGSNSYAYSGGTIFAQGRNRNVVTFQLGLYF